MYCHHNAGWVTESSALCCAVQSADRLLLFAAGLKNILIENEELLSEKNELARELREMEAKMKELSRYIRT